jgi:hypothetical protein
MVSNPNQSRNWDAGEFLGGLTPLVEICALNASKACVATALSQAAAPSGEQYQLNWKVPRSSVEFYRISVYSSSGGKLLGSADVQTEANASLLKNIDTGEEVGLVDGSTLPIKFRVEKHALESYASAPIALADGGIVSIGDGSNAIGVSFPGNNGDQHITVSVSHCDDLNPRAIDLPVFGPCVRVRTDPAIAALKYPATVFACEVNDRDNQMPLEIAGGVLDEEQAHRITMHRLDGSGASQIVAALRHADANDICGRLFEIGANQQPRGMLASLRRRLGSAGRALASLVSPKPVYAAKVSRFIDLGGGGFTDLFSDFQFALPASLNLVPAQIYRQAEGASFVSVRVCDVNYQPVRGVTVRFAVSGGGSLSQTSAISNESGDASTRWTFGSGTNAVVASGRGVGGTDFSGPRNWTDPFQPLYHVFDDVSQDQDAVPVLTGSVSIPGVNPPSDVIGLRGAEGTFRLASSTSAPTWRIWNAALQSQGSTCLPNTY